MPKRSINLTDHHDHFIESLIGAGEFKNASEVMRAGLRLLEQKSQEDEEKRMLLRRLANEAFGALDRGEGVRLEGEQELEEFIQGIGQRASRVARGNGGA